MKLCLGRKVNSRLIPKKAASRSLKNQFLKTYLYIDNMEAYCPLESLDIRDQPLLDSPATKGRFNGQVSNNFHVMGGGVAFKNNIKLLMSPVSLETVGL